jgi:hypothetical protein
MSDTEDPNVTIGKLAARLSDAEYHESEEMQALRAENERLNQAIETTLTLLASLNGLFITTRRVVDKAIKVLREARSSVSQENVQ